MLGLAIVALVTVGCGHTATTPSRKVLGSVATDGAIRRIAGVMTKDGRRLELAVDTCPEGLAGTDSEWPMMCTGSPALTRISVDTSTWSAVLVHRLDASALSQVAPTELAFGYLAGDPLLSIPRTRTVGFHADSETVLPPGCGVGDVLYQATTTSAAETTTTMANSQEGRPPAPRLDRFDSNGAPMASLAVPAATSSVIDVAVACSADSVYAVVTSDSTRAGASDDNSALYRLDGEVWSEPLERGRNGYFREVANPTAFMDVYFADAHGGRASRVVVDRAHGTVRRGEAPEGSQPVVIDDGGTIRHVTVSADRTRILVE